MSVWFSEYRVRCLAQRLEPRIQQIIERIVLGVVCAELPALLIAELERDLAEQTRDQIISADSPKKR